VLKGTTVMEIFFRRWGALTKPRDEYKKAIALNPYYPPIHYSYGLLMRQMGRFDEAKREYINAMQLDPDIGSKMTETWIILD